VLDRNWRCSSGELDLVLQLGSTVVFCEVKARTSDRFGEPFEAVTAAKQTRIRRLAARWLRSRGPSHRRSLETIRFDVVSILGPDLEVIEEAF
jgi:putative endonuclease